MDTATQPKPQKLHRGLGRFVSFVLVALITAAIMVFGYTQFVNLVGSYSLFEQPSHVRDLYRYSYALNWKLQQVKEEDYSIPPVNVMYPELTDMLAAALQEGDADLARSITGFSDTLHSTLSGWDRELQDGWDDQNYLAMDDVTGEYYGNPTDAMLAFAAAGGNDVDIAPMGEEFRYFAVLHYGPTGQLTAPVVYGANANIFEELQRTNINEVVQDEVGDYGLSALLAGALSPPHDVTIVFAIPRGTEIYEEVVFDVWAMQDGGLWFYLSCAVVLAAAMGLLFASIKVLGVQNLSIAKLPLEVSALLLSAIFIAFDTVVASVLIRTFNGRLLDADAFVALPAGAHVLLGYALCAVSLFLFFGAIYAGAASLWQLRTLGARRYFTEKCLIVRVLLWIRKKWRGFSAWLTQLDFAAPSSRQVLKVVLVNAVVLFVIFAMGGGFAYLGLAVYCAVVLVLLVRALNRLKAQYKALADATKDMADGKLDITIEEDLGPFAPLGENLSQVQQGFSKAVEAETRSQNMKTELITNVSHDLKTPLTAIITYIGLLKKEGTTEAERESYLHTLDKKSQRLKHLIEDLFEMSKASSRDVTLNLAVVNLPSLVRQVVMEAADELAEAGIEFRYRLPPEKILLTLDGEKTSRIFENLVLNVAKYGMPGTRAYVEVHQTEREVTVEVKNVSRDELNFDNEQITERFVRGDLSRSTEGSGLGLAIAKSFTELQGGRFEICTDGDVFKALLTFPQPAPPAPPEALPPAAHPEEAAAPPPQNPLETGPAGE